MDAIVSYKEDAVVNTEDAISHILPVTIRIEVAIAHMKALIAHVVPVQPI